MFLQCHANVSDGSSLSVTRAVEQVQKGYYDESEQWGSPYGGERHLKPELTEQGTIDVPTVAERYSRKTRN